MRRLFYSHLNSHFNVRPQSVTNRRFYRPKKLKFYISVHEGLLPCREYSLIGRLVGYCKRSTKSIVGDAVGEQRDELLKEISAGHN